MGAGGEGGSETNGGIIDFFYVSHFFFLNRHVLIKPPFDFMVKKIFYKNLNQHKEFPLWRSRNESI